MSATVSFNIKGVQDAVTVHGEYTDQIVNTFWAPQFETISLIFSKDPGTLDADDAVDLFNALNTLKDGAINGIDTATGQPIPAGQEPIGRRYYLTIGMASSLDLLLKTLESVGFDTVTTPNILDPTLVDQVKRWQDLDDVGLREILIKMGDAIANNRSLQALIELEYVKAGNELIGDALEDLDEALRITKETLEALETAQRLHNKLEAATRDVNNDEAEFFNFVPENPIQLDPPLLDQTAYPPGSLGDVIFYNAVANLYKTARDNLNAFLAGDLEVSGVTLDGPITTAAEVDALATLINGPGGYNELAQQLETARLDLNDNAGVAGNVELEVGYYVPSLTEIPPSTTVFDSNGEASGPFWTVRMFDNVGDSIFGVDGEDFEDLIPDIKDGFQANRTYDARYENAMIEAFSAPLGTKITISMQDLNDFIEVQNDLVQLKDRLAQINPESPLIERIETILADMAEAPGDSNPEIDGTQPLIMTDSGQVIGNNPENSLNRILFWIADGYQAQDAIDAGINQRHLTEAIVAAQGLNDQQKEDLRRFMYLFEQFYKSASSMLQAIDRMVAKMAQNIKG